MGTKHRSAVANVDGFKLGWRWAMKLHHIVSLSSLLAVLLAFSVQSVSSHAQSGEARTLSASKVNGISPQGESITVSGNGFNVEKGIYVAFCVIPAPGETPSPCGGGADLTGSAGSSVWISSNPPAYGVGLAVPYGPGGSFSVQLDVGPVIKEGFDCRVIACAIVTRADHTRLTDRTQDMVLPVSFASAATATPSPPPGGPTQIAPTTAGSTPIPTATALPSVQASPTTNPTAPAATLAASGLSVSAGGRSLSVSKASAFSTEGESVTVTGKGFEVTQGVYVALCAIPQPGKAPGPCLSGSAETSVWISSNPPEFARSRATPYGADGSFEVRLSVSPTIDSATDCRKVACAIATRNDDTNANDRSQDLLIPVSFQSQGSSPTSSATTADPASLDVGTAGISGDGGGTSFLVWFAAALGLIAAGFIATVLVVRKRRAAALAGSVLLLIMLFAGCSDGGETSLDSDAAPIVIGTTSAQVLPVTVQSADGREVRVTDTTRIVSLWGNITEVVYGLGLGENIVGRDSTATFPEVAKLPLVTRGHDLSVEGVLSLNPTLVLASKDNSGPSTALDQLRNIGIPVVMFKDPESVEEIVPRIRLIASALGVPASGEDLVRATESEMAAVQAKVPNTSPPRVAFLYMRGQAGVYLIAGPRSGADSMIRAAGALDAGTEMGLTLPFTPITSEALAKAAPDYILMTTTGLESVGGLNGLLKIPGIAQTPAGRSRNVIEIEDSLLYSFGPRTPQALSELIAALYGDKAAANK